MKLLTRTAVGIAALIAAGSIWAGEPQSLQKEGGTASPYAGDNVTITSGNSATIVNGANEYGAVYTKANLIKYVKNKLPSTPIGKVSLSFVASGTVAGGAPRFSIPIDSNLDGTVDAYAFIDVNSCNGAGFVSTTSATCKVYYTSEVFDNWAAFVAAHPKYEMLGVPFIIADQPGTYVITSIDVK